MATPGISLLIRTPPRETFSTHDRNSGTYENAIKKFAR